MRGLCSVFALVALSAIAVEATAGKWPLPAAGASRSSGPEVLFTFDDGPHERHTGRILDSLAEHNVLAIFFWTGLRLKPESSGLDRRLALVARAVSEGHLVANHTSTHPHMCRIPGEQAEREIDQNAARLHELSQLPILFFRTPYGDSCKRLRAQLKARQLDHLHWDIDPQEFRNRSGDYSAQYVIRRIRRLKNNERAVILMHDTQPATTKAIPLILEWIDSENRARTRRGQPRISILSGSDLAEEKWKPTLLTWATDSLDDAAAFLKKLSGRLIPGKVKTAQAGSIEL